MAKKSLSEVSHAMNICVSYKAFKIIKQLILPWSQLLNMYDQFTLNLDLAFTTQTYSTNRSSLDKKLL
jgi:hypothetical protein